MLVKFLVGGLVFALIVELLVTLVIGTQVRFPRHVVDGGFGVRINEPGARYRHRSPDVDVEFRINSRGLRSDREYPYEKPAGTKRIVSLGDSFAAGYEVEIEECYTTVLERSLRERGLEVEVLNAGVSGYSNAEACLYLERELYKYEPDLVLLSFFNNDLVDNVRSNLFRVQEGQLVQKADAYIPLGGMGNFLNTNFFFNFLSERSNAFALLKEQATLWVKRRAVEENVRNMAAAEQGAEDDERLGMQRELAARILDRIYDWTQERGIPFVVQNIPLYKNTVEGPRLIDVFPRSEFDLERPGLAYLPAASFLEPHVGQRELYHLRSHTHWTPFSNELSGQALAALIADSGLLAD